MQQSTVITDVCSVVSIINKRIRLRIAMGVIQNQSSQAGISRTTITRYCGGVPGCTLASFPGENVKRCVAVVAFYKRDLLAVK